MSSQLVTDIENMRKIYIESRILFDQLKNDKNYNADRHLDEVGHFINENTVVRLAASLEEYKNKLCKNNSNNIDLDEAAAGTTILFRNCILHHGGKLEYKPDTFYIKHYKKFCDNFKDARVKEGDKLCLSISEVVLPLIDKCLKYIKRPVAMES
jgi:hypothetical protein